MEASSAILVIDDEDYVADMLATALELEGYTVHVAYNGQDGLQQAQWVPVQLIIVDIMMPYLNGEMVIQRLREREQTRSLPIILISAGARPRQIMDGVVFVPKPFDIDAMLALVAQQLQGDVL